MRTYYFDTKDGAIVRDTVGLQFLTASAAIEHGKHLAQQLRGDPRIGDPNLYIRVIDESGAEVHREQVYKGQLAPRPNYSPKRTPKPRPQTYLSDMPIRPFQPCIPTRATKVPAGPDWLHEIKHDGYRLIVQKINGKLVRLFTRNGHDWTDRRPLIVEAALRNRSASFVIDGEAVLLDFDGVSDFDGLHSRKHDDEVQIYAFDTLMLDDDDLRKLPLAMRKANLARLLARRPAYRAGTSPNWVKVKNPKHPAMMRVMEALRHWS